MLIKILMCHVAVSLSFAIYASELSVSQTCEDEGHLVQQNSSAVERIDSTANELYLGQDAAIESFGLQIRLGEKDDMIYPNLLWHYRMGCRNFEILHQGLSESQAKKVKMFHERVKDICSLNTISVPKESEFISTLPESLKWILAITDRQILCLHKPLAEILSENDTLSLSLPSCEYSGFDPEAPVSFWPQTDERLIYRTPIDYEQSVTLLNRGSSGDIRSNSAHVANFVTMEEAGPFTSEMMQDQLPTVKVLLDSLLSIIENGIQQYSESECPIMDVWHGYNIKFFGVAKSGTSTIREMIASSEFQRKINLEQLNDKCKLMHKMRFEYSASITESFTCVRNPYSRALSMFLYLINDQDFLNEKLETESVVYDDFSVFLKTIKNYIKEKGPYTLDVHMIPQIETTENLESQILTHVIHLENFERESTWLLDRLNLFGTPANYFEGYHATNATSKLSQYYTKECVELVAEIYGKDFEYFGYSKIPQFTLLAND